jgi:hypothetical protein
MDRVQAAENITVHEKYAKIQSLFRSFQKIKEVAEKHPEDAQMRRTVESTKKQLEKIAQDIKNGISKIEKSEVGPNFQNLAEKSQELIKSTFKGAKVKRIYKEVKCTEIPERKTWKVSSLLVYSLEAKGATPLFLHLFQQRDIEGHDQKYKYEINLEAYKSIPESYLKPKHWSDDDWGYDGDLLIKLKPHLLEVGKRRGYEFPNTPEAKKNELLVLAKDFLFRLNMPGDYGKDSKVEMTKESVRRDFRSDDFFTPDPLEEDDDHPHFTGKQEVIEFVKKKLPVELKNAKVSAYGQEKSWFTVEIYV